MRATHSQGNTKPTGISLGSLEKGKELGDLHKYFEFNLTDACRQLFLKDICHLHQLKSSSATSMPEKPHAEDGKESTRQTS
jgi:hypothetical protein